MYKDTLDRDKLDKIGRLFQIEAEESVLKTVDIMSMIGCSRSFVSKLRTNYKENDGFIILKKPGATSVKELQAQAIKKGAKFFVAGKACKNCGFDRRYTSTGSCAPCSKIRNQRKKNSDIISADFTDTDVYEVTELPIFPRETIINSGLLWN